MAVTPQSSSAERPVSPYRQEALDALDIGSKLDRHLRATKPVRWVALAAILVLIAAALIWAVAGRAPVLVTGSGALLPRDGLVRITSLHDGAVVDGIAEDRTTVAKGETLLVLEGADGTRRTIVAPTDGELVERSPLSLGDRVADGDAVGAILPSGSHGVAVAFVNPVAATSVAPGMTVLVTPDVAKAGAYGRMVGTITSIDRVPFAERDFIDLTAGNDALAASLASEGSLRVVIALTPADTPSGFLWTSENGPPFAIPTASAVNVSIQTGERAPISFLVGG